MPSSEPASSATGLRSLAEASAKFSEEIRQLYPYEPNREFWEKQTRIAVGYITVQSGETCGTTASPDIEISEDARQSAFLQGVMTLVGGGGKTFGYYGLNGGSRLDEYVMDVNLMAKPWPHFSIVPSVRVQKEDTDANFTGLETLEAELASSGFQQMEAGQGMLASIAAGEAAARALGVDPNATSTNPADGGDYPARLEQAREWREMGRLGEAFSTYRVLLKMAPNLLPDVAAEIEEALRVAPDHPEARRLLGDVKLKQGDYMGALEAYNRAVELAQSRG